MKNLVFKKVFFFLLLIFLPASAQEGKSTTALKLPEEVILKEVSYEPVDLVFWEKIEKALSEKNYLLIVNVSEEVLENFPESSPEYDEAKLSLAIAFYHLNFSFAAQVILKEVASQRIGSQIGNYALNYLDEIAQNFDYDREDMDEFINANEFADMPEKVQSFVSFHRTIYNFRYGFREWAEKHLKLIHPLSFWNYEYQYLSALAHVARDNPEAAMQIFRALSDDEKTPKRVQDRARLQIARIIFEQGQFEKAIEIYGGLNFGLREKGRIILESAWNHYYLKKYDRALGLLTAFQSPYYAPSITYESYILEMIIYKQICHYEAVREAVQKFYDRFEESFDAIKKRKDLRTDPTIASIALMELDLQKTANFVDLLRRERFQFELYDWEDFSFYKRILKKYEVKDKELRLRQEREIERKAERIAEELLDAKEQVDFIDYSSSLDALRIVRKGENRDYRSERIEFLRFDTIYWPFGGEYWLDEVADYKVLISSQCYAGDKFEEEFEEEEEEVIPEDF